MSILFIDNILFQMSYNITLRFLKFCLITTPYVSKRLSRSAFHGQRRNSFFHFVYFFSNPWYETFNAFD